MAGIVSELARGATVVVIRLRSLGDTVLTTPALCLLKRFRPDLRIVVVIERPFAAVLDGNPDVSEMLVLDRGAGFAERCRIASAIRKRKPALCLNLHGGTTSAWWTALSGARFRAGFQHYRMGWVYNVPIPRTQQILGRPPEQAVHTAEHQASAMFHLGADSGVVELMLVREA